MSRQPPLPRGPPPPRDSYYSSRDARDSRDNYDRAVRQSNSYRPRDLPESRYDDSRGDIYHFSGNSYGSNSYGPPPGVRPAPSGSSYRPGDRSPRDAYPRAPPADSYRPHARDYGGPPSYAPSHESAPPASGFNFRFEAPSTIQPRQYDDRRDNRPRSPRPRGNGNENGYRQNNNYARGARGGYRGRAGPRLASDRAFLKTKREPTPELMPGMDGDVNHTKFQALDGLSDSDETDMEISEDEDENGDGPRKKLARTDRKTADGDSAPRWSNPDPYTALPPPDESQRKKKDVVKLIRKARVENGVATKTDAATEDFISFDFGGDEEKDKESSVEDDLPPIPTGPRFSHRDHIQKVNDLPPRPPLPEELPPRRREASPVTLTSDPALGNRKRTRDDEIKGPPIIHKPTFGKKNPPASGKILSEWRIPAGTTGTPWMGTDHSQSANMGVRLHKEIMDFYHHVKPREFEQAIRSKLVKDLEVRVSQMFDASIQAFGSFMAGLYLPTADMDLVCLSDGFLRGRYPAFGSRTSYNKFKDFLLRERMAAPNSVEVIPKAKVPLVKYVDRITGLKVDISFENDTGVVANKTFQAWKKEFPAMPILVTVIKHFLAMRGLNEPVNGGIGGFSVTCLVVSLLQQMPQVQSRNMIPEHHLGEVLMEFFDLYGNQFNVQTTAVQTNPPAWVRKEHDIYRNSNQIKFSIIDPNRPSNDIAGGSSNTSTIIKAFSKAYDALQARMGELQHSQDGSQSILGCILAGNYQTFQLQREHLAHIHEKLIGPIDNRTIL